MTFVWVFISIFFCYCCCGGGCYCLLSHISSLRASDAILKCGWVSVYASWIYKINIVRWWMANGEWRHKENIKSNEMFSYQKFTYSTRVCVLFDSYGKRRIWVQWKRQTTAIHFETAKLKMQFKWSTHTHHTHRNNWPEHWRCRKPEFVIVCSGDSREGGETDKTSTMRDRIHRNWWLSKSRAQLH